MPFRQRFLLGMVGDGPDTLTRATELANKFEQHVFSSTATKVPCSQWRPFADKYVG